ncbi:hypothetical protein SLNSH_18700 [Alsobacter soli]|uniref:Nitrate reductase n=1 Tax=Alsobacter soli TaxID=2109933 RepID=A0A2T1HP96_9HYPH|nr:hypothetical protein SLNSH_18700 [Alsobacter soli]
MLDRFRAPRPDPEDVARVKAWAAGALGLGEDDQITVNEIACTDPACPGLETVILVMRAGEKTRAVKIAGSLVALTRPLVEKAVQEQCS